MTARQWAALLLLSMMWGGSFLFMRVAAPQLGPVLLVEARTLVAGLLLVAVGVWQGSLPDPRRDWRSYLLVGALNSAAPFVLISTAELHITASLAATLNATTPLFGALVGAFWMRESLGGAKLGGLLLGFAGVAVLVGLGPVGLSHEVMVGIGASLLAAMCYGFSAVLIKQRGLSASPLGLAAHSQLAAALLLAPAVPFTLPAVWPSTAAIACTLALALLSTALGYILYFGLIGSAGPTRAMMVTYLSPVFGMLWGWGLLGEPLGVSSFVGLGTVLASVGLVSGAKPSVQAPADLQRLGEV